MNQKKHFLVLSIFAILATSVVLAVGTSSLSQSTSEEVPMAAGGPGATVPACSIPTQTNDVIVTFPQISNTYLTANDESRANIIALDISGDEIPAGDYVVILESYDNHDGTIPLENSIHDQRHEQWQAQLFNDDDVLVTQTNAIDDIPDENQSLIQQVNNKLSLSQAITKVIAQHAFYPAENPQSHYPICAVFRPIDEEPPVNNNCEKPIDFSFSPICNLVTSEGSATIDWAKVDSAIGGYDYQLSLATNFKNSNRINEGVVDQPLGSVRPGTNISYIHPPTLHLRARSKCTNNEVSNWSNWQTIDFVPDFCGGPSPTPSPAPIYDVKVNLRTTDDICVDSKPLLSGTFSGRVRANPLKPGASNIDQTTSTATLTFENLQGEHIVRPIYADFRKADDIPALTKAIGPFCQAQQSVSNDSEINFYFTPVKGPWWQSSFGDIFSDSVLSKIPPTATKKVLSLSDTDSDAGVVVWNADLELGTGKSSDTDYHVHNQQIPTVEDVAYFREKLHGVLNPIGNINGLNSSGFYQATGHQTLSLPLQITGDKKIVVLIDGPQAQLTITQPIQIDPGSFFMVVVDGPVTFAATVNQVRGIFLASGDITIGASDQAFTGYGSFISIQGDISSHRSLPNADNNTMPATKFVYDPGLVIHTPPAIRSITTRWQEINP